MPEVTHVKTREVRDLCILGVPERWRSIDNDEQIKAAVSAEIAVLMMTQGTARSVSGATREQRCFGIPRDFNVTLVRTAQDLEGLEIEHQGCQECVDAIELLRMDAANGTIITHVAAVIQYTFDEIVSISVEV